MNAKKWIKYDIILFILWTIIFILGLFNGINLLSYILMYLGLVCEILKYIAQIYYINKTKKKYECNHSCGESCNCSKKGENNEH